MRNIFVVERVNNLQIWAARSTRRKIVRNFFEIITGTDRNITRISMCVIAVARLRNEAPDRLTFLLDQVRKSRQNRGSPSTSWTTCATSHTHSTRTRSRPPSGCASLRLDQPGVQRDQPGLALGRVIRPGGRLDRPHLPRTAGLNAEARARARGRYRPQEQARRSTGARPRPGSETRAPG